MKQENFLKRVKPVSICPEVRRTYRRTLTALASFQGSGNTWTRYLLEYATGIATGSLYCDLSLNKTFIGECLKTYHSVLVIKTLECFKMKTSFFQKAIILIRNPHEAIIAEFNRRTTNNHTGFASKRQYKELFEHKSANFIQEWFNFYLSWYYFEGRKIVVTYENLKKDTSLEIRRLVNFLNISVPRENFERLKNNTEGNFHRSKNHILRFDPTTVYTPEIRKTIQHAIQQIQNLYELHF